MSPDPCPLYRQHAEAIDVEAVEFGPDAQRFRDAVARLFTQIDQGALAASVDSRAWSAIAGFLAQLAERRNPAADAAALQHVLSARESFAAGAARQGCDRERFRRRVARLAKALDIPARRRVPRGKRRTSQR